MSIDPPAIVAASRNRARLVFVCSPNNPTGGLVAATVIGRLAEALQHQALLVVDEAYIEFADRPGATALLDRHPNLVVLRTLSKAWGLAGSRIGAVLAQPGVIAALRTVQPPYPLAAPATDAALQTVSKAGEAAKIGRASCREREEISGGGGGVQGRVWNKISTGGAAERIRSARAWP